MKISIFCGDGWGNVNVDWLLDNIKEFLLILLGVIMVLSIRKCPHI